MEQFARRIASAKLSLLRLSAAAKDINSSTKVALTVGESDSWRDFDRDGCDGDNKVRSLLPLPSSPFLRFGDVDKDEKR